MAATADLDGLARRRFRIGARALPYLLSLPALLVCIGILIPFFTAVFYSLQRYRLSQPWARQMNWGETYWQLLTDSSFWNTLEVSLTYTVLTVGLELVLGLGIALLLQKRTRLNNFVSIMLLLPLMTAPALAAVARHLKWSIAPHKAGSRL
jgi:multiple sugar transport system permease protein